MKIDGPLSLDGIADVEKFAKEKQAATLQRQEHIVQQWRTYFPHLAQTDEQTVLKEYVRFQGLSQSEKRVYFDVFATRRPGAHLALVKSRIRSATRREHGRKPKIFGQRARGQTS